MQSVSSLYDVSFKIRVDVIIEDSKHSWSFVSHGHEGGSNPITHETITHENQALIRCLTMYTSDAKKARSAFLLHENERSERRIYAMNNRPGWSVKCIPFPCCFTLRPRSNVHRVPPSKWKYLNKTFPNLSGGLPQLGCQAWSLTINEEDGYQGHVIIILKFQNQSVSFSPSISSFTIHGELLLSTPVFKCGSPWQHRSFVTGASSYKGHGTGIYFSVIRRSFSVDGNPVKPIQSPSIRNTALNGKAFHWWTNVIR